MKVAILTQPLFRNYGGILQNYALQIQLKRMGYEPVTIDYRQRPNYWMWFLSCCKSLWLLFREGHWRGFLPFPKWWRTKAVNDFLKGNVCTSKLIYSYDESFFESIGVDAFLVGSDQVWRPVYNKKTLTAMFLDFAQKINVPKVAYAASFGTNKWEYSEEQTSICKNLVQKFNAVSVREQSGVDLCKRYLDKEAAWVLDPTLLLSKDDYDALIPDSLNKKSKKAYLACYLLDRSQEKVDFVKRVALEKCLEIRIFNAEDDMALSIEEWLAVFRNAEFVITDSFHGTVFSIIFKKDFYTFVNEARGADRFSSLLDSLGISGRLVSDTKMDADISKKINYTDVEVLLSKRQDFSYNFLKNNLACKNA